MLFAVGNGVTETNLAFACIRSAKSTQNAAAAFKQTLHASHPHSRFRLMLMHTITHVEADWMKAIVHDAILGMSPIIRVAQLWAGLAACQLSLS